MATSYTNPCGSGGRDSCITVTATIGLAGTPTTLVDGNTTANNLYFNPGTVDPVGKYFRFEFLDPVVIDEAKWYQSGSHSHGTWKWQGSNNGTDWTDVGSSFTLGGSTLQTQTSLNGNTTQYLYYQLIGISGAVDANPYLREIEFKIAEATRSPAYVRRFGVGDRRSLITISETAYNGTSNLIINGLITGTHCYFTGGSVVGDVIQFDLGVGNSAIFVEATYYQNHGSATNGDWKWQGSNNGTDWTDIGSSFTLGGALKQVQTQMSANNTAYRYYRLLGVSGSSTSLVDVQEFLLRESDGARTQSPVPGMPYDFM